MKLPTKEDFEKMLATASEDSKPFLRDAADVIITLRKMGQTNPAATAALMCIVGDTSNREKTSPEFDRWASLTSLIGTFKYQKHENNGRTT